MSRIRVHLETLLYLRTTAQTWPSHADGWGFTGSSSVLLYSKMADGPAPRLFDSLPFSPQNVCWPGGSPRHAATADVSTTAVGASLRLGAWSYVKVCVCVCVSPAPSGGEQQVSEECDYSSQWEEAGLWQVWLKMEELA